MYNAAQFSAPMVQPQQHAFQQQQTEAQQKLAEAFNVDPNSNTSQFNPVSSQFSSMPQIQTFDAYPQVQTQISLQGMPPLTVNTPRIDPSQYS